MPGVLKNIDYLDPFTRYKGQKILDNLKRLKGGIEIPLEMAIDVYYTLYLPFPQVIEVPDVPLGKERQYKLIKTMLSDEEAKKLRLYTVADSFASVALGTLFLLNLFSELGNEEKEIERGSGRGESGMRNQQQNEDEGEGGKSFEEAVKNAIKKTADSAETVKEVQHFVYGYKAGVGHTLSLDDDVTTVLRLVRNTDIKNILNVLTRIPDIVSAVKKKRVGYQRGEIEGYSRGSDIERIVYTELAYPQIYFYTKIAEGDLLLFEKVMYLTMGPIYVLLDKSGSMDGNKILWAKATALALFMRSRLERRAFYIRFFDSEPYEIMSIKPNTKPSYVAKLLEYIAMIRNGGGTDISKALMTACNDILKSGAKEASDIILITDGEDRIAKSLVKKALIHAKARLISVMIMGDNEDLREISDNYMKVVRLSDKEMLTVVKS
ncbi:MAG: VWA domain-containing protein [Ignisphaera sp.]